MIIAAAAAAVATAGPPCSARFAVILVQLQMLLDCCDGEVARWRQTSSPVGVYLDRVGHYVAECGIAVALGVRATGELRLSGIWISAGLLLGLLIALNKVENDLVHVARHYAGLPQMRDARGPYAARRLPPYRAAAGRAGPFHRVFHSVELSILVLIAAIIDLFVAGAATKVLLAALVIAAAVTLLVIWSPCWHRPGCDERACAAEVWSRRLDDGQPARRSETRSRQPADQRGRPRCCGGRQRWQPVGLPDGVKAHGLVRTSAFRPA